MKQVSVKMLFPTFFGITILFWSFSQGLAGLWFTLGDCGEATCGYALPAGVYHFEVDFYRWQAAPPFTSTPIHTCKANLDADCINRDARDGGLCPGYPDRKGVFSLESMCGVPHNTDAQGLCQCMRDVCAGEAVPPHLLVTFHRTDEDTSEVDDSPEDDYDLTQESQEDLHREDFDDFSPWLQGVSKNSHPDMTRESLPTEEYLFSREDLHTRESGISHTHTHVDSTESHNSKESAMSHSSHHNTSEDLHSHSHPVSPEDLHGRDVIGKGGVGRPINPPQTRVGGLVPAADGSLGAAIGGIHDAPNPQTKLDSAAPIIGDHHLTQGHLHHFSRENSSSIEDSHGITSHHSNTREDTSLIDTRENSPESHHGHSNHSGHHHYHHDHHADGGRGGEHDFDDHYSSEEIYPPRYVPPGPIGRTGGGDQAVNPPAKDVNPPTKAGAPSDGGSINRGSQNDVSWTDQAVDHGVPAQPQNVSSKGRTIGLVVAGMMMLICGGVLAAVGVTLWLRKRRNSKPANPEVGGMGISTLERLAALSLPHYFAARPPATPPPEYLDIVDVSRTPSMIQTPIPPPVPENPINSLRAPLNSYHNPLASTTATPIANIPPIKKAGDIQIRSPPYHNVFVRNGNKSSFVTGSGDEYSVVNKQNDLNKVSQNGQSRIVYISGEDTLMVENDVYNTNK